MNIVTAKCTNCGATLKINSETNECVCQYCGTPFVTQEAINYFNTTIINNTTNHITNNTNITTENLTIQNGNFDNLFSAAISSWNAKDYSGAYEKFSKALELKPNDINCTIYKSLCLAITNRNIAGATATYKTIFVKPSYPIKQELNFVKSQLENFNLILLAELDAIIKDFSPNCVDNSLIERAWHSLENALEARMLIVEIAEKIYENDISYKNNLLTHLKNLLDIYDRLTAKWKRLMPMDYRYHVTDYHPQREAYLEQRETVITKIKSLDHEYVTKESAKANINKFNKLFKCLCIVGTIGITMMLGIIIVGLVAYGHVYTFNGYAFTAVLSIISIIFMLSCFTGIVLQFILSKDGKATFPKSTKMRVLVILLAIACLVLSIYAL